MRKSFGLLTARAACKRIGVGRKALSNWIRSGIGPERVLVGKRYYYKRESIDVWIEKALTPVAAPRPKPQSQPVPSPAGSAAVA